MAHCRKPKALVFSSRRRHTSSKRDWSSDVCSSDLVPHLEVSIRGRAERPDLIVCDQQIPKGGASTRGTGDGHAMAAKILIVDDRAEDREYLVTLLGYHRYRLLEASGGAQALAVARIEHPDLVISDILMPTMDG